MTPKEKAKELFGKYATYVVMWAGDVDTTHQNCKQCALIAVNIILNNEEYFSLGEKMKYWYWQEVKKEIEQL